MLEIRNLNARYDKKPILKNINLSFKSSSINAILGLNGAGKSTLLKAMLGIIRLDSGEILYDNKDILKQSIKNRAKLVSYMPQTWNSPFDYKVYDVLSMGLENNINLFDRIKQHKFKILNALEILNIVHLIDENINSLSGGQISLVLLARVIIQDTPIILLDEPTAHLDIKNQKIMLDFIKKLKNKIILINIHEPSLALDFANNIIALKNGNILFSKPSSNITKMDLEAIYESNLMLDIINDTYFIKLL
ncbi:MAG: ABC transporter ATP-binding protein [Helicobacteraceae bacterium]|nr:ABC transporter ATP-binding protein [Helicobacteraceae bacterium]